MPDENSALLREIREEQIAQREQIKTLFKQQADIKELTEIVHKLATSVQLMSQKQGNIEDKLDSINGDVEEIKSKPAKRWDNVVTVIITAIVTAVITYALTKAGLKP